MGARELCEVLGDFYLKFRTKSTSWVPREEKIETGWSHPLWTKIVIREPMSATAGKKAAQAKRTRCLGSETADGIRESLFNGASENHQ